MNRYNVYIIGCRNTLYYKIGLARDVSKRLADLQVSCPHQLYLVKSVSKANIKTARKLEHWIQWKLNKFSIHGEWFELNNDYLNKVEEYLFASDRNLANLKYGKKPYKRHNYPVKRKKAHRIKESYWAKTLEGKNRQLANLAKGRARVFRISA